MNMSFLYDGFLVNMNYRKFSTNYSRIFHEPIWIIVRSISH